MGISQLSHGTASALALIHLAFLTGHVGRDGTGLNPLRGQNNVQGASDMGAMPFHYPGRAEGELAVSPASLAPISGQLAVEYRVHCRVDSPVGLRDLLLESKGTIALTGEPTGAPQGTPAGSAP